MKFAILESYAETEPEAEFKEKDTEVSESHPEEVECSLIPLAQAADMIDKAGYDLANSDKISTSKKIDLWVEFLRWAHPLIEDGTLKSAVQQSIENPSEWDFMERRGAATL